MGKGLVLKIVAPIVTAILLGVSIAANIVINVPIIRYAINEFVIKFQEPELTPERVAVTAEGDELAELIELEGAVLVKNENNLLPLKSSEVKKLNVFGWSSTSWVGAGSGSGRSKQNLNVDALENPDPPYTGRPAWSNFNSGNLYPEIDFYGALMKYGIEFNQDLRNYYFTITGKVSGLNISNRPYFITGTLGAYDFQYSRLVEPAINEYPAGLLDSAKQYSDYAVVVISRVSGESNDSPKVQYKGNYNSNTRPEPSDATRHYLEISTEEEALLTYVGQNYPGKNIVLINSTNTMELGFLDKIPGLGACLIVGATGPRAATAIPKLLFDQVTYKKVKEGMESAPNGEDKWEVVTEPGYVPSGRTVNTYAYDFKTNPTWASMGHPEGSNFGAVAPDGSGQKYYSLNGNNNISSGVSLYPLGFGSGNYPGSPQYKGLAYIDYMESIYVDYRWYETADRMGYWNGMRTDKSPAGVTGYDAIVQYPFGYGLSYTTFEQHITKATLVRNGQEISSNTIQKGDKIRVEVLVSNTGTLAAKEVVQIYYEPPYTAGGVEKASANLVAFAKTSIIQPGYSERVTLEFDVYEMASYDCYNLSFKVGADGGYILEGGEYKIKLMDNAHSPAKGLNINDATRTFIVGSAGIVYDTDPVTGNEVKNRFTGDAAKDPIKGDGVPIDGSEESTPIKYLSRSNFKNTFPTQQVQRDLTDDVRALNRYTHNSTKAFAWNAANQPETPVTVGAPDNGMRLSQTVGGVVTPTSLALELGKPENYDDPRWDQLLSQMSVAQMMALTRQDGTHTPAQSQIGFPQNRTSDGPSQFGGWSGNQQGTGFPNPTVLAQTFNVQLSYKMGLQVGNDAIRNGFGNGAWLAPGVNIHRSPFGSRNYEYYSADPLLSGKMAAYTIQGCLNKGVYVYVKHLILYDQDTNRDSLYTWLTEQALREIYLKPFRIAIQEGEATGIMTAYNRIGAVWTGGSYPLMTSVIREEMGFKGSIVSDWIDRAGFMDISHKIRGGGDLAMANGAYSSWENQSDPAFRAALRRANRNIAYSWANAKYRESIYNPEQDPLNTTTAVVGKGTRKLNFDWITFIILPLLYVLAIGGGGAFCVYAYKKELSGIFRKG